MADWWPLKVEARYGKTTWFDRLFVHVSVLVIILALVAVVLLIVGVLPLHRHG